MLANMSRVWGWRRAFHSWLSSLTAGAFSWSSSFQKINITTSVARAAIVIYLVRCHPLYFLCFVLLSFALVLTVTDHDVWVLSRNINIYILSALPHTIILYEHMLKHLHSSPSSNLYMDGTEKGAKFMRSWPTYNIGQLPSNFQLHLDKADSRTQYNTIETIIVQQINYRLGFALAANSLM